MNRSLVLSTMLVLAAPLSAVAGPPAGASSDVASSLSTHGSAALLEGSLMLAAGAGELAVASLRSAGESTVLVLESLSEGATVSITVALQGVGALSLAAGDVLRLVGTASGHLLVRGSEVLAFVPDAIGASLFHHERLAP